MKVTGFTYVRNGFQYGYPFLASIQSILPIVEELIVVIGDSVDGSREAVEALNEPKIKIIDSVWDENLRISGKIFAIQSNIGLDNIKGDWGLHIQADEVLHENAREIILKKMEEADQNPAVEGIIFPFLHFWGNYNLIRNTRGTHRFEIRAFKNNGVIRSYKDSQGFRKYPSINDYAQGHKGNKLKVIKIDTPIYHYSYTRHPRLMKKKSNFFNKFWQNDEWLKKNTNEQEWDYNAVDALEPFYGVHPKYMREIIAQQDWEFQYDPTKSNMPFHDKILNFIDKKTGVRLFEYRNYKLL